MAVHPLAMVTADEVQAARRILGTAGHLGPDVRFAYLGPEEPAKADLLAHNPGDLVDRRLRVLLLDRSTGAASSLLVSVTRGVVDHVEKLDPAVSGQSPIMVEEFEAVQRILDDDPAWGKALARRGLTPETVRACPLSAGHYAYPEESGRRVIRSFGFHQDHEHDHPWAHPVDGLVAYVDLVAGTVMKVIDEELTEVPREPGNFQDAGYTGPARTSLRPIEITQPEGPSFTVEDGLVHWENWSLRIGFNVREGLTLHQISFRDQGRDRPVIHRASIAEMVVPYADPSPVRFWQNYFDQGEYLFGRFTNSLELGCDCVGEIHYTDVVVADEQGEPATIRNAICMHEEDYGVLWKHSDMFAGSNETRRQRRLVISFFTTVGNYDYGFYWYLYLDGTIGCECKATGVLFTSAYPPEGREYAAQVAPGLAAPFHQHLFSARLDMAVDGHTNAVDEIDAVSVPMGEGNPYGNAFARQVTRLATESQAQRLADPSRGRVWQVVNPQVTNRLGAPVGYTLIPEPRPTLLADPASSIAARAAFATRHLWVTRHADDERFPAGDLINQHPGGGGLPAWTAADRSLDGEDIVLWHTFGVTHFPRTEDWPVMPVDHIGFSLKPTGFFDRNPTLDVPRSTGGHCHPE
ncbi:primary-amine oxidase [Nonomuraea endophytica]|uniref:Amine oxidase n=1 Tax=Nonomuraea endophytica TaxID=714136 RepID=A0A7W8EFN4_9ACTN|nr:primary-amine oxidase [Nonomuraea endophytica]MBB5077754.1 primary-amine oxidase [Nonomuraea endophytica]